ncbi:glycine receptor subunit alpha-4-like [Acanthaster planci]|uniref:Glycine receptor subunit alpha-4-like n=1 Tax=Acanthaster planci TaxID=133434 RepID=A0A8B7Z240_ACAPL|nr:glycine receptor subunit alpha-4-like [Acanthaster planci]
MVTVNLKLPVWVAVVCSLHAMRQTGAQVSEAAPRERNMELENKTRDLFESLLDGYDRKIRPYFGTGRPVRVKVDIYLASFDNIHEDRMEYGVTIYLRQKWHDPRLHHSGDVPLPPTSHYVDHLWVPDLIISNAKQAEFKDVTFMNRVVDIDKDGNVLYVSRLALQLSCSMDFHRFPLDSQGCEIEFESFEYTTDDLIYHWDAEMPIEYHHNHLKLPQYNLDGSNVHACSRVLRTGNYSCIGIRLIFSRKIGYYMLQTYVPSMLLVVMSWVSFWIQIKGSPARVALGVTTVLTMITTTNGVRQNLPPVSYVKAIDVWFAFCLVFVIGALMEFALVHYLVDHKPNINIKERITSLKRKQSQEGARPPSTKHKQDERGDNSCVVLTIESKPTAVRRPVTSNARKGGKPGGTATPDEVLSVDKLTESEQDEAVEGGVAYLNHAHFEMETIDDHNQRQGGSPMTVNGQALNPASRVLCVSGTCGAKRKQPYLNTGQRIDSICRWAFPLAFVIFNFGYWISYSHEHEKPQYIP